MSCGVGAWKSHRSGRSRNGVTLLLLGEAAMPTKRVNAYAVLNDIRAGMYEDALMLKYDVTAKQLRQIVGKLQAAGLIDPRGQASTETEGRSPEGPYECPACGFVRQDPFEDCPKCGVVVSKISDSRQPAESGPKSPEEVSTEIVGTIARPRFFRVIALLLVAIGCFLLFRALSRDLADMKVITNLRPMLRYMVASDPQAVDWAEMSDRVMKLSQQAGDRTRAQLTALRSAVGTMADLQRKIGRRMPELRTQIVPLLDPELVAKITDSLAGRLSAVQAEAVDQIIRTQWEQVVSNLRAEAGIAGFFKRSFFRQTGSVDEVRLKFSNALAMHISKRLQNMNRIIQTHAFFGSWPRGKERYDFSIETKSGRLGVSGEYDLAGLIFNDPDAREEADSAVEKLLSADDMEDLPVFQALQKQKQRLIDYKKTLNSVCDRILAQTKP